MINISLAHTDNFQKIKLIVSGHANYNFKGQDIVCAAVSVLVDCFLVGLEQHLEAKLYGTINIGYCNVDVEIPKNLNNEAKLIFNIFKNGFKRLADRYSDYVKIL